MNKKGFTLIEIIVCIVLLLSIGSVIVVNIIKINSKNKEYKEVKKELLEAANVYINMEKDDKGNTYEKGIFLGGNALFIPIDDLYNKGYINDKIITTLENNANYKKSNKKYLLASIFKNTDEECDGNIIAFKTSWDDELNETTYLCSYSTTSEDSDNEGTDIESIEYCKYNSNFLKNTLACKILEKSNTDGSTKYRDETISPIGVNYTNGEIIVDDTVYIATSKYVTKLYTGSNKRFYALPHYKQYYGTSYEYNSTTKSFEITNKSNSDGEYIHDIYEKFKSGELNKIYTFPIIEPENFNPSITGLSNKGMKNAIFEIIDIEYNAEEFFHYSIKYKKIYVQQAVEEKTLSKTSDDYGDMAYYYRGTVTDNYLNFNGMCWRITKINSDGTIRIILADETKECSNSISSNSGFIHKDDGNIKYFGSKITLNTQEEEFYKILPLWYETKISDENKNNISKGVFCSNLSTIEEFKINNKYGEEHTFTDEYFIIKSLTKSDKLLSSYSLPSTFYYDKEIKYIKNNNETIENVSYFKSLKCSEDGYTYNSYISLLSVQEYVFAGAYYWSKDTSIPDNPNYYLLDNLDKNQLTSTFSGKESNIEDYPYRNLISINDKNIIPSSNYSTMEVSQAGIRPVINLKKDIKFTGTGTATDAYTIIN